MLNVKGAITAMLSHLQLQVALIAVAGSKTFIRHEGGVWPGGVSQRDLHRKSHGIARLSGEVDGRTLVLLEEDGPA